MSRLSYEDSLEKVKEEIGVDGESIPTPTRRPAYDDETTGPSLFRTGAEDARLADLTLPGFYIGRSELNSIEFKNSDFHLSTWCWNDFNGCDFSDCDFTDSDLRASIFDGCRFRGAVFTRCDLRHSSFVNCDFTAADMRGAVIARDQADKLKLDEEQKAQADWKDDQGPEPPGG